MSQKAPALCQNAVQFSQDAFANCQRAVELCQKAFALCQEVVDTSQRAYAFSQRAAAFFPDVKETVQTHKIFKSEDFGSCQNAVALCQRALANCQNASEFLFLYTKIKSYRSVIKLWRTYFLSWSIGRCCFY